MFEEAELLELFQRTLACDYDDDGAWEAVNALRASASRQVFDKAAAWLRSENPLERARAADILGQIGVGPGKKHAFPAEACDLLLVLLLDEGHAVLRHAVAFALGCFVKDSAALPGLMVLMSDADEDVRDWATFSLGVWGDLDSARVREALARRLGDDFQNVRLEAIAGLAKRNDMRVLPALIETLDATPGAPDAKLVEAACLMLGLRREPRHWKGPDFALALRHHFGCDAAPIWQ